jgi:hypothetical protein
VVNKASKKQDKSSVEMMSKATPPPSNKSKPCESIAKEQDVAISADLLEEYYNLAEICENALIRAYADSNAIEELGIKSRVRLLRQELAGPRPSPLESILIERIACCWIQAHHADILTATWRNATIPQAEYLQRRQDHTARRFLQACKALAQVRKLLGPNIQVNVAEKQVNILQRDAQ